MCDIQLILIYIVQNDYIQNALCKIWFSAVSKVARYRNHSNLNLGIIYNYTLYNFVNITAIGNLIQ